MSHCVLTFSIMAGFMLIYIYTGINILKDTLYETFTSAAKKKKLNSNTQKCFFQTFL